MKLGCKGNCCSLFLITPESREIYSREIKNIEIMANQATTTYKVTGTRKAVNDLWSTLQKMEVNSKNIWLYQVAEHYGIDYEAKQISVRGHIYWAEYEEDPANDYYLLSFETETAWDEIGMFLFHPKSELQQNRNTILYKPDIQMTQKNMVPILGVIYY